MQNLVPQVNVILSRVMYHTKATSILISCMSFITHAIMSRKNCQNYLFLALFRVSKACDSTLYYEKFYLQNYQSNLRINFFVPT